MTTILLSDGRELRYFDRAAADRSRRDRRRLSPTATASELRWDASVEAWVTIASHRQRRTHLPREGDCPLCPSTPDRATEVPAFDYEVVAFENRFPSFAPQVHPASDGDGAGPAGTLFATRPGRGRCEVVCFSPDHDASFADLGVERAATILAAWTQRSAALAALDDVQYVYVFENRGLEIGVTLSHPHGQIYAYPFVPPRAARMLDAAARYRSSGGRCLACDLVAAELADGRRVVVRTSRWVAYVPFAARWPFQVQVSPLRHVGVLGDLDDDERAEWCQLYLDVLGRLDGLFDRRMPYVAGWHQASAGPAATDSHLSMEVFSVRRAPDKLKHLAGSESGQGAFVNDITPESAARMLRAATRRATDAAART